MYIAKFQTAINRADIHHKSWPFLQEENTSSNDIPTGVQPSDETHEGEDHHVMDVGIAQETPELGEEMSEIVSVAFC